MKTRAHYIVGIFLLAIFWGGSFLGIRYTVQAFPPISAAAIRVIMGAMFTLAFMYWRRVGLPRKTSHSLQLITIGFFCLGLPWALLFWGEQFVSPGMCAILNSSTPLFTVVLAAAFLKSERVGLAKWLGVIVGLAGIIIIFGPTATWGDGDQIKGLIALTGMAFGYALGISWIKVLLKEVAGTTAFFMQCIGALIFLIPAVIFLEGDALSSANWMSGQAWIAMLFLGLFSTTLAQIIFITLIRKLGPVVASAVTYLVPIVAIALDWAVFQILPSTSAVVGGLVIIAGVTLVNDKSKKSALKVPLQAVASGQA